MSRIPTITEQELSGLSPAGLNEDFLARLTACAEGTDAILSAEEAAFEMRLRAISPKAIPNSLRDSLIDALGDAPFAVDEKIVLFNKPSSAPVSAGKNGRSWRLNIAAAAAVALLGSLAAFMVPAESGKNQSVDTGVTKESVPVPYLTSPSNIAPAGYSPQLSETRDEGVIWRGKNQPHRVLRLTYMDRVIVKDAAGNPVTVERPRVEYVIVPEKID